MAKHQGRPSEEIMQKPFMDSDWTGTKLIRKFKLKYDINEFVKEIDELFPPENYKRHNEFPSPKGTWFHNLYEGDLPKHLEDAINESIGVKIKPFSFLWDWKTITTELIAHKDNYAAATGHDKISVFDQLIFVQDAKQNNRLARTAPLNVVVALENYTQTDIFDEEKDKWQSCSYGPGEIIFFDNENYWHQATVIGEHRYTMPKRSLNCYVDPNELNDKVDFFDNLDSDNMRVAV